MSRALVLHGGPGHDFGAMAEALAAVTEEAGLTAVLVDDPREAAARLADGGWSLLVVLALRWRMDQDRYAHERDRFALELSNDDATAIDAFVRDGGGLLALHTAVICFDGAPWWRELCGATWSWERSAHPPLGTFEVAPTDAGRHHPLTAGIEAFTTHDESYRCLDEVDGLEPLLVAVDAGAPHPVLWAREVGAGRVVTDLLGHDVDALGHPAHRTILTRAAAWAAAGGPRP